MIESSRHRVLRITFLGWISERTGIVIPEVLTKEGISGICLDVVEIPVLP